MNRITTAIAAASLALSAGFALAQAPQGQPGGVGPDRAQMREAMKAAHEACKDKPDRRACMAERFCARSQDPAKCMARAKEHGQKRQQHVEQRQKMHEACNGKRGPDLESCMKGQRQQMKLARMELRQKAHEACNGRRGDELGKCLQEQREKLGIGHRGHHRGHHQRG
jgi:hypothetical protein